MRRIGSDLAGWASLSAGLGDWTCEEDINVASNCDLNSPLCTLICGKSGWFLVESQLWTVVDVIVLFGGGPHSKHVQIRNVSDSNLNSEFKFESLLLFRKVLFNMARKRKNRTHLKGAGAAAAGAPPDGIPKSFVIKHGQVGSSLTQLVRDIRKVMEPNTASRLKVSPPLIFKL
jgi:hypothetical protein